MTTTVAAPAVRRAPTRYDHYGLAIACSTVSVPGRDAVTLACNELAMALHHARAQLHCDLAVDEVVALVFDGIDVLGGVDAVRHRAARPGRTETPSVWPHGMGRYDMAAALAMLVTGATKVARR
ncbi:hypothetical protein [Amycolatopsis sp. NPDC102389]|uniref:hypothetical protein n=1 Tax=Amycolatopsis sp. NPDC102389 TaxID=3363941 RepID=UPI003817163A